MDEGCKDTTVNLFHPYEFAGLENVDGLGELSGSQRAAELVHDPPGLET